MQGELFPADYDADGSIQAPWNLPASRAPGRFIFYLGTHKPAWLATAGVPLFVSRRSLEGRRSLPEAIAPWALDSGGYSELDAYGEWRTSARDYAAQVRRIVEHVGRLEWAAQQDWMCEPWIIAKTGKSVREHQELTVQNFLELRSLAPDLPIVPVLQGWTFGDYLEHVEMFARAGVDLRAYPRVGVGTVCRRQATTRASMLLNWLHAEGLQLHGFGFKLTGLPLVAQFLRSSDSLAWSFDARKSAPLPGCTHARCNNCLRYALAWRARLLANLERDPGDLAPRENPWQDHVSDPEHVSRYVLEEMEDATERALRAGAVAPLRWGGAGGQGIVLRDARGRAFKVARGKGAGRRAEQVRDEAAWFRAARDYGPTAPLVPEVYGWDPEQGVLEREWIEGERPGWRAPVSEWEERLTEVPGWIAPERGENQWVVTPDGPKMVDAGFALRKGEELARYVERLLDGAEPWFTRGDWDGDGPSALAFALRSEEFDGRIATDRAQRLLDRLRDEAGLDPADARLLRRRSGR